MKLLSYITENGVQLGLLTERGVLDVSAAAAAHNLNIATHPANVYSMGTSAIDALRPLLSLTHDAAHYHDEGTLRLAAAVPYAGKILCIGLNYRRHAAESGMQPPSQPVLFSKFSNSLAAHNEDVPMSREWQAVDYEAELAVIIGKTARHVSEADALDYVLGYANANDLSERDLQLKTPGGQWLLGKTLDKFLPIGPYVVTADEIPNPQALQVRGWMNGELRQDSNTSDMIFSVAQVIAHTSRYFTLNPGDIISTGTPEGVILGRAEKIYMQPGDDYAIEIEGLGRLYNRMVEE